MRMIANSLVTTSLVVVAAFAAVPAKAADLDATSAVDAVTVYPDGASVTRVITARYCQPATIRWCSRIFR